MDRLVSASLVLHMALVMALVNITAVINVQDSSKLQKLKKIMMAMIKGMTKRVVK